MTSSLAARDVPSREMKEYGMVDVPPPPAPAFWQKSRASSDSGPDCVEFARTQAYAWVRDSKDPLGPALGVNRGQWMVFLAGVQCDEFGRCGMPVC